MRVAGGQTTARFKPFCATSMPVRILGHSSCLHGFICKKAPSRTSRHHALNDLVVVARAFASAAIPVAKEPQGLSRADCKRWCFGEKESHSPGTSLLSALWLIRTLVTLPRMQAQQRKQQPHAKQPNIRRSRADAHLSAGCRRKFRHDESVSIRLLSRAWVENLGDIWRRP